MTLLRHTSRRRPLVARNVALLAVAAFSFALGMVLGGLL